jgi:hypothetical protein
MLIGEIKISRDKTVYTVVNSQGTLEKLGKVKWYARLYLEIRQGLIHPWPLPELRKFIKKHDIYTSKTFKE